jgi:transcription elongation factor Elf1
MTLMDVLKKKYVIQARCSNCGEVQEISVPKGITINNFFKDGMGKCLNCGCSSLEHLKPQGAPKAQGDSSSGDSSPKSIKPQEIGKWRI